LTTWYKRSFWWLAETEDDTLINQNARIKKDYKNPNYAAEYMEAYQGTEEEIYDNIDKWLLKEAKEMKEWKKYFGKVISIDKYGNAIISFYEWDIQWMIYRWEKIGLEIWEERDFVYKRKSKRKNRFVFELPKQKNLLRNVA
jgi:S-adenosylmethionine hydrolase